MSLHSSQYNHLHINAKNTAWKLTRMKRLKAVPTAWFQIYATFIFLNFKSHHHLLTLKLFQTCMNFLFCWTQNKTFWRMLVLDPIDLYGGKILWKSMGSINCLVTTPTFFKISLFVFNRKGNSYRFGTTSGWVNDGWSLYRQTTILEIFHEPVYALKKKHSLENIIKQNQDLKREREKGSHAFWPNSKMVF